jgi:heterodisulfide reductase subunit B
MAEETGKKKYTYYPGCSSQGSAAHLDQSLRAIAPELGIELEELDDWNCCGASVGHIAGGALPTTVLSGRNLAKAEQQGPQDILTGCAACYLNTHGTNEKIKKEVALRRKVNEALSAADLSYDADLQVRHACEVIVNDVGIDKVKDRVTNPLDGLKVAGYVGCQPCGPSPTPTRAAITTPMTTPSSSMISSRPAARKPWISTPRHRAAAARCR